MNVLYVTNMYPSSKNPYNGIYVKEQIDHLSAHYKLEYKIYIIDGASSKLNYFKSIFFINDLLRANRFDLIHIHFGLSGLFLLFNPFLNVPTLVTIHGSDIGSTKAMGLIRFITKAVVKRAHCAIILNDKMIKYFSKQSKKLFKIPCGINLEQFNVVRNNSEGAFLIGFPGDKRRKVKNFAFFEEIVVELLSMGYHFKVIEFHNLSRIEVAEALSKIDCLVMTSHREGSPQIIKEAMVCGTPVISVNVGDVEFLLEGLQNCYVINSYSIEDFVEKIITIIQLAPNKRITDGRDNIKLKNLDQESVCARIFDVYKKISKNSSIS